MEIYRFMEITDLWKFRKTFTDLKIYEGFSKIQLYFGDVKLAS